MSITRVGEKVPLLVNEQGYKDMSTLFEEQGQKRGVFAVWRTLMKRDKKRWSYSYITMRCAKKTRPQNPKEDFWLSSHNNNLFYCWSKFNRKHSKRLNRDVYIEMSLSYSYACEIFQINKNLWEAYIFGKNSLVFICVLLSNVSVCEQVSLIHCMLCTIPGCYVQCNMKFDEDKPSFREKWVNVLFLRHHLWKEN